MFVFKWRLSVFKSLKSCALKTANNTLNLELMPCSHYMILSHLTLAMVEVGRESFLKGLFLESQQSDDLSKSCTLNKAHVFWKLSHDKSLLLTLLWLLLRKVKWHLKVYVAQWFVLPRWVEPKCTLSLLGTSRKKLEAISLTCENISSVNITMCINCFVKEGKTHWD